MIRFSPTEVFFLPYLTYRVVLALPLLESLVVSSVSAVTVGASQVTRAVSVSPALLGFTEIIRTLQSVFRDAKTLKTTKMANFPFIILNSYAVYVL